MLTRIVSISTVAALLILLAPIKITFSSEAAMVEDPFNATIAPHFSKVVYTLTEPDYATSCDERGDFKALVGTPSISISNSRLAVSPVSSAKASAVLSKTDAPEINQTEAYYEMGFNVSNALSWTNISLYDLSGDWINISVHSGAFYYDYDSGTRQLGVFYSPAGAGTDHVIAFDLTTSSVTLFLYGTNGTLLADKYISNNRLVGGDLDEIRFELQGSSSQIFALDYLYVLGSAILPGATSVDWALEPVNPDDTKEEKRLDLDPTAVTLEQSLRAQLFGFQDVGLAESMSSEELLNVLGTTDIQQQRASGRLVSEGYKNLQDSVEDALISYIADLEDLDTDEIYLIDYYVDYLQCKIQVHNSVVDKTVNTFKDCAGPIYEQAGVELEYPSGIVSVLSLPAQIQGNGSDWKMDWVLATPFVGSFVRGLIKTGEFVNDPFGMKDWADNWEGYMDDIYGDAQDRIDLSYNQSMTALRDWQQSTDEKYEQVRQDYLNFVSIVQAQTAQLASEYKDMQDRFERTISKYYSWTENQFEASNAVIAKLLLQNEELSENAQAMSEYFAGQLTKSNEVVLNITDALTQALSAGDFWKDVMDGGKPAAEALTFSGLFGNNLWTWTLIFVGLLITVLVIVVALTLFRPGRRGRKRRQ